jgi:FADH2 O2-dependent halogenase
VLLLEKGKHPRFAIGESSTPVTTFFFERFSRLYGIPEFEQFASYKKMKMDPSQLNCGPKELFYYMYHELDKPVSRFEDMKPEIAMQIRSVDLQYDRAAMDEHLVKVAQQYGATYIDRISVTDFEFCKDKVALQCEKDGERFHFEAKFMIDGTGFNSLISEKLGLRIPSEQIDIPLRSRTIYSHFRNVKKISEVFNGECRNDLLTIPRERSTQHHVFDGGWYWGIPFDNGVTSFGVCLDMDLFPENDRDGKAEFWEITNRLPIVKAILEDTETTMPFVKSGRMQYLSKQLAGDRWALLPFAASFLDPWQSTGLTVSMLGIERLVWSLDNIAFKLNAFERSTFQNYENSLGREYHHLARFIHGIYKSFKDYRLFRLFCLMPALSVEPFAIAGGMARPWDENSLFMNFGNPHWRAVFYKFYNLVVELNKKPEITDADCQHLQEVLLTDFSRYNTRQYGCPSQHDVYMNRKNEALEKAIAEALAA